MEVLSGKGIWGGGFFSSCAFGSHNRHKREYRCCRLIYPMRLLLYIKTVASAPRLGWVSKSKGVMDWMGEVINR